MFHGRCLLERVWPVANDAPGEGAMLDVIVLVAMVITAAAFAAGLIIQAGLPILPVYAS